MTPIGHLAIGFAAKSSGRKVHLGVLLAASWLLDVLYMLFAFTGLESAENFRNPGTVSGPWSHGLFMALVWSALTALLAGRIYRSRSTGAVIGLVVFSHWLLDLINWDNLPIFFEGSPQVGFGLFNALGESTIILEAGLFLIGIVIYTVGRFNGRRIRISAV